MNQMMRSRWMPLAGLAVIFVMTTGGACPPNNKNDLGPLADGEVERGPVETQCSDGIVQDAINLMCNLIPGTTCSENSSTCNTYSRQVFMGTELGGNESPNSQWNGMGGSGELMSDAIMCSLKELSPSLAGPQRASAQVDVIIGTIKATQEVGFLSWDRLSGEFRGYRKLRFDLPVLGTIDAVTQDLHVTKNSYSYVRYDNEFAAPLAGSFPITGKHGLTIDTQEKEQRLKILPPGFSVATPIGPFNVQPQFSYENRASVIDSPYDGSAFRDLVNFNGITGGTVRLSDLYGVNPGTKASDDLVTFSNFSSHQTGWSSQLALGNRNPSVSPTVWSAPASGAVTRPDENILVPRSGNESDPSVEVSASAKLRYPANPADLLPAWVFSLPFLSGIDAYVSIEPKLRAAFSDQFNLGAVEGAYHYSPGEFKFSSSRASAAGLWGGVSVSAGFSITAGLRLYIGLDLPFYGTKKIVDLNATFPINGPELKQTAALRAVNAVSTGRTYPERLNSLQTFQQNLTSRDQTWNYIQQCYAAENDVADQPAPEPVATPGNPAALFPEDSIWPCNICVFVPEIKDAAHGINIAEKSEYLMPSVDGASFRCNRELKNGCMDWCSWDKNTNQMTVVVPASGLKTLVQGTDNTYATVGRPWLNIRYDSCETP